MLPGTPSAYLLGAMKFNSLPAGFIIPAQPVLASKPPVGVDWVHEKHDGYRMIVRRDGPLVRLYSRNAYDWTVRLAAIAGAAAERMKAKSFTIDGEAVCSGLTACHGSRSCPVVRPLEPRSSTPSTLSSMMARICAIAHSWTGRLRWRDYSATPSRHPA